MSQPAKYMFDNQFDASVNPKELDDAERETERQRSFEDGYQAGEKDALNKLEGDILRSIEAMVRGYEKANASFASDMQRARNEAVEIAVAVAKKLSGKLVEQYPLDELMSFFEKTLQEVGQEANLTVRVAETLVNDVETRLSIVQASASTPARITVVGSERLAPGAGQVEWRDGRVSHMPDIMFGMVDDAVNNFLSSRPAAVAPSQSTKKEVPAVESAVGENIDAALVADRAAEATLEAIPETLSPGGHHE